MTTRCWRIAKLISLCMAVTCGSLALLCISVVTARAEVLTVYTEEFPPYNYTKDNQIRGVSTEVVKEVLIRAGLDYQLISLPWARALKESQARPNSLIFSISRRKDREKLFHWIGVITPSVHSVFSLTGRTDISLRRLSDLKEYSIATVREDARETHLLQNGFAPEDLERLSGDGAYERGYQLLKLGRIDLWPIPDAVAFHVIRGLGQDPKKEIVKVFEFSELSRGGYYLAASLSTPVETVVRIRQALDSFKQSPDYRLVLNHWGLKP